MLILPNAQDHHGPAFIKVNKPPKYGLTVQLSIELKFCQEQKTRLKPGQ